MPTGKIPLRVRLAYSIGHFQNDLMASMWFSYLLVYLHQVKNFNNIYAGTLLLVGQIADAIATPLIGYEADAASGCCGYTKRKSWHLFGLICTTCSFPFIFAPVFDATPATPDFALFIYYAAFVVIFQIGWASVQISHLSLIPQLTSDESEVAGLNGWRYAATGVANLATYAIAWVILSSGGDNINPDKLTSADSDHFRNLGFIVTGIGLVTNVIFHIGVPEPKHGAHAAVQAPADTGYGAICQHDAEALDQSIEQSTLVKGRRRTLCQWFTDIRFYQVALIYMSTRLFVNISQVYLPMYLTESIQLDKVTIANVPLVCYATSFVTSMVLKVVDKRLGRVLTYLIGVAFALGSSIAVYFIPAHKIWMVYIVAATIGVGGALMLITSLSFVADLIGDFTGSSAFVYGAMSFTDKLANGAAVEIVQLFHPCVNCCPACQPYYRKVQTYVPGGSATMALVGLCTLFCSSISNRSKPLSKLMHNPAAVDEKTANGHAPDGVNGSLVANGNLPPGLHSPSLTHTIAEVHPDPSRSLNDGRITIESDNEEEKEDAPLLRRKQSIRNSEDGLLSKQER